MGTCALGGEPGASSAWHLSPPWPAQVEPDVHFTCNLERDPFRVLQQHNASLAWTIVVSWPPLARARAGPCATAAGRSDDRPALRAALLPEQPGRNSRPQPVAWACPAGSRLTPPPPALPSLPLVPPPPWQMSEVPSTIPSLWPTTQRWLAANPQHLAPDSLLPAFLEDEDSEGAGWGPFSLLRRWRGGQPLDADSSSGGSGIDDRGGSDERPPWLRRQYTGCHFWSNFEIGRLSFFRSEAYRSLFAHLDAAGGFFYER